MAVAVGGDWCDGTLLAAADIPIVIRDDSNDQRSLLRYVPGASVTTATGLAGWCEALFGSSAPAFAVQNRS